jgi:hypothetical protein
VSVAGPLAAVLRTIAEAIEDGAVKPPKPKVPQGRFKSVEAFHPLVERWRKKAAEEGWGLGHAYDECADELEAIVGRPEDAEDGQQGDEGDQR